MCVCTVHALAHQLEKFQNQQKGNNVTDEHTKRMSIWHCILFALPLSFKPISTIKYIQLKYHPNDPLDALSYSLCRCVFLFILMLFFRYFACVCVWTRRTSVKNQHRFTHLANWIFIFSENFPFRWCRYFHYFIIWDGVWFTYFQSFMKWKTTEELLAFFFLLLSVHSMPSVKNINNFFRLHVTSV